MEELKKTRQKMLYNFATQQAFFPANMNCLEVL